MFVNENIKRTERVFPMQGRYGYLRYDMNENRRDCLKIS